MTLSITRCRRVLFFSMVFSLGGTTTSHAFEQKNEFISSMHVQINGQCQARIGIKKTILTYACNQFFQDLLTLALLNNFNVDILGTYSTGNNIRLKRVQVYRDNSAGYDASLGSLEK